MKPGWKFKYVLPESNSTNPFSARVWVHYEADIDEVIEQFVSFLRSSGFCEETIQSGMNRWKECEGEVYEHATGKRK